MNKIEEQRNKVVRTVHQLDRSLLIDGESQRRHTFSPNGIAYDYQEHGEDDLVFHSFESDDDDYDVEDKFSPDCDKLYKPPSRRVSGINLEANGTGVVDLLSSSRINSLNPLVKVKNKFHSDFRNSFLESPNTKSCFSRNKTHSKRE